jgi:hypothetical protein
LATREGTYPEIEREKRGTYYFSRVAKHGERRKGRIGLRHFRNAARFTNWVPERASATPPTRLLQCSSGDRQAIRIVCAIAQASSYEPAAISLSEKALATA